MQSMQALRLQLRVLALFLFIGAISHSHSLLAQNTSPVHTGPMPDERFYSLVFRHIIYLHNNDVQNGITEMQPAVKGSPVAELDNYYRHRLKTTAREENSFLTEAQAWATDVAPIDTQAHNIIASIRSQTPGGKLGPGEQPPPPPQILVDLQKQRDAITLKHVSNLHETFGDGRFSQLNHEAHRAARLTFRSSTFAGYSNPMASPGGNQ